MAIDKKKLAYAISALWGLISLPVSEVIYDDIVEESGLLMRLFALLLALMPVWLVFGWRWLTDNKPISPKLWLAVTAAGILTTIGFAGDYSLDELTWIPILGLITFLALVWAFERGAMLWWRNKTPSQSVSMPATTEAATKARNPVAPTNTSDGDELKYYEAINAFITSHGFYESFLTLQGTDKDYCIASMKMHKAAYISGQPHAVAAALTIDSIRKYEENRPRSILFLHSLEAIYLKGENDDDESYHPALDKAVSEATRFLETEKMYVALKSDSMSVHIASELLVYIASYLAMRKSGQKMSTPGWNSFKASIENRILDTLENPPTLSDHIVTPEGETFVHYTSDYFTEMTRMEALVANRATESGEWNLLPLASRILIHLGSDNPQHPLQLHAYLADVSEFASNEIIPKVIRAFE